MAKRIITDNMIKDYCGEMHQNEMSTGTIKKYFYYLNLFRKYADGKPMDRSNIWREMKQISRKAGINPDKVFPHNLRHLFARVYYSQEKDLVRLADILGHSSVNTTRIYTMESGENHLRQLEKMNLLIDRYNRIPLLL